MVNGLPPIPDDELDRRLGRLSPDPLQPRAETPLFDPSQPVNLAEAVDNFALNQIAPTGATTAPVANRGNALGDFLFPANKIIRENRANEKQAIKNNIDATTADKTIDIPMPQTRPQLPAGPAMERITSTTTQSPNFNPKLLPQMQALLEQKKQDALKFQQGKEDIYTTHSNVLDKWTEETANEKLRYGEYASDYLKKMQAAETELARIKEELKNSKLDPNRLWDSMTTGQAIVGALALGLSRYSTIGTDGAIKVLNDAVDKDLMVQRDKIERAMKLADLTERQEQMMWQRWNAMETERKGYALSIMKTQLAKVGLDSDKLQTRNAVSEIITGLQGNWINIQNEARAKSSTTVQTRPAKNAGVAIDPKTFAKTQQEMGAIDKQVAMLDRVYKQIEQASDKYILLGKGIPNTDAESINKNLSLYIGVRRRLGNDNTGVMSDKDIARLSVSDGRFSDRDTLMGRLKADREALIRERDMTWINARKSPQDFDNEVMQSQAKQRLMKAGKPQGK